MKLLDGIETPEYGHVHVRPGMPSEPAGPTARVRAGRDADGRGPVGSGLAPGPAAQELEEAAQEMAEADPQVDRDRASRRYDELHERLVHQDAYSIDHRVEEILYGLQFTEADFNRPARTFSGGQQSRLMLAKLLLEDPDLMLLDEPSNHLDFLTETGVTAGAAAGVQYTVGMATGGTALNFENCDFRGTLYTGSYLSYTFTNLPQSCGTARTSTRGAARQCRCQRPAATPAPCATTRCSTSPPPTRSPASTCARRTPSPRRRRRR